MLPAPSSTPNWSATRTRHPGVCWPRPTGSRSLSALLEPGQGSALLLLHASYFTGWKNPLCGSKRSCKEWKESAKAPLVWTDSSNLKVWTEGGQDWAGAQHSWGVKTNWVSSSSGTSQQKKLSHSTLWVKRLDTTVFSLFQLNWPGVCLASEDGDCDTEPSRTRLSSVINRRAWPNLSCLNSLFLFLFFVLFGTCWHGVMQTWCFFFLFVCFTLGLCKWSRDGRATAAYASCFTRYWMRLPSHCHIGGFL